MTPLSASIPASIPGSKSSVFDVQANKKVPNQQKIHLVALAVFAILSVSTIVGLSVIYALPVVFTLGINLGILAVCLVAFKQLLRGNNTSVETKSKEVSLNASNFNQRRVPDLIEDKEGKLWIPNLRPITEMRINNERGTPGVNLLGADEEDRKFVIDRTKWVEENIRPFAHTKESYKKLREYLSNLTGSALQYGVGNGSSFKKLLEEREKNQKLMLERFKKALTVEVVGAGPIGLTAALTFYRLGFQVRCFEQYLENQQENLRGFTERSQPFGLVRQSFWFLNGFIPKDVILEAFGIPIDKKLLEESQEKEYEGKMFDLFGKIKMSQAREKRIGPHAKNYVPNTMSLPIQKVQKLLMQVFKKIQEEDKEGLQISFGKKCINVSVDQASKSVLLFDGPVGENDKTAPDIIYNASGGKISESLGFKNIHVADMYGLGAFFNAPNIPLKQAPLRQLSRAVRPFCSFNQDEPIYANMELSKEEYEDKVLLEKKLILLQNDLGLKTPIERFEIKIELSHVNQGILKKGNEEETFSQLCINGGDSVLKPHFITASGANFGLLGLAGLDLFFQKMLQGSLSVDQVQSEYNELCGLLQKQSYQMILELFARPFLESD